MNRIIYVIITHLFLTAVPICAGGFGPLPTPVTSYSGGVGFVRYSAEGHTNTTLAFCPADMRVISDSYDWNILLSYGFEKVNLYDTETVHNGALIGSLGFKVGNTDPIRLSLGMELISFNRFYNDYYYSTHTLGPRFSFIVPLSYNNSYNEIGFGAGFGCTVEDYTFSMYGFEGHYNFTDFIIDLSFSENIEVMFNDKFGVGLGLQYVANVFGPGYCTIASDYMCAQYGIVSGSIPNRFLLQVGPVLRW